MEDERRENWEPLVTAKPPIGPPPGTTLEVTQEKIDANRRAGLKNGNFAKFATQIDVDRKRVEDLGENGENVADVFDAYAAHFVDGETEATTVLAIGAMTSTEIIRRRAARSLAKDGLHLKEPVFGTDKDGQPEIIGERIAPNPAAKIFFEANTQLGFTATDHRLTPKSRGEGDRDDAIRRAMERDALLRSAPKGRMAAPIETSASEAA